MKRDVIITVYSCSKQAPCSKWAKEFFTEAPLLVNVPVGQFRSKAIQWARTGDLFKAAVKDILKQDIEIGKRGLVTFSLGWIFADELVKFKAERERLDAYILLDGCHTSVLDSWCQYADIPASGNAFMVMAHSSIKPPYISTTTTNSKIFQHAESGSAENIETPDFITNATLPENGITIYLVKSGSLPAISRKWTKDPLISAKSAGNLVKLHYSGNDRPDHVYIAWYVSKRLWKWLGQEWSKEVVQEFEPDTHEIDIPDTNIKKIEKPKQSENIFQIIWTFILMILSFFKKKD